ncbi:hypothetical protein [Alteribacter natronophilus]|uniref:hypothetical protein n=1 Tax=Alteribacter natronophilus TaxID=2583810 RepID=UPI00110EA772|nr:hypothetical protein [Alteribacter natronophilus]TMW71206.1 hypothetical protein FGB90_14725 [Alteribacter natronophilus]
MKTKLLSYPMIAAYGGFTAVLLGSVRDGDALLGSVVYGLILGVLFFVAASFVEKRIVKHKKSG